jgi:hypothetical protein
MRMSLFLGLPIDFALGAHRSDSVNIHDAKNPIHFGIPGRENAYSTVLYIGSEREMWLGVQRLRVIMSVVDA